jgi:hypothetical protein
MSSPTQSLLKSSRAKLAANLNHPDDLHHKLAPLKQKYTLELQQTTNALKTTVNSEIGETNQALEWLQQATNELKVLKDYLKGVGELCMEARGMIGNYPKIRKVSRS